MQNMAFSGAQEKDDFLREAQGTGRNLTWGQKWLVPRRQGLGVEMLRKDQPLISGAPQPCPAQLHACLLLHPKGTASVLTDILLMSSVSLLSTAVI